MTLCQRPRDFGRVNDFHRRHPGMFAEDEVDILEIVPNQIADSVTKAGQEFGSGLRVSDGQAQVMKLQPV